MGARYREYLKDGALLARNERLVRRLRSAVGAPYDVIGIGRERRRKRKDFYRRSKINAYYREKYGGL